MNYDHYTTLMFLPEEVHSWFKKQCFSCKFLSGFKIVLKIIFDSLIHSIPNFLLKNVVGIVRAVS